MPLLFSGRIRIGRIMTVDDLMHELMDIPNDATVHAYEGEGIGILIREAGWVPERDNEFRTWWLDTEPV